MSLARDQVSDSELETGFGFLFPRNQANAALPTVRYATERVTRTQITLGQVGEYFHIQRICAEAEEPNGRWEILDQRVLFKQSGDPLLTFAIGPVERPVTDRTQSDILHRAQCLSDSWKITNTNSAVKNDRRRPRSRFQESSARLVQRRCLTGSPELMDAGIA